MPRLTRALAGYKGFEIDDHCYPPFAYSGPRFKPNETFTTLTEFEEVMVQMLRHVHGQESTPEVTKWMIAERLKRFDVEIDEPTVQFVVASKYGFITADREEVGGAYRLSADVRDAFPFPNATEAKMASLRVTDGYVLIKLR